MLVVAGYLLLSDFVIPHIELGSKISETELLGRIILPVSIFVLLAFYICWECILNIFAEITRFADR